MYSLETCCVSLRVYKESEQLPTRMPHQPTCNWHGKLEFLSQVLLQLKAVRSQLLWKKSVRSFDMSHALMTLNWCSFK